MTATAAAAPAATKSYHRENALPFNKNGVYYVLITKALAEKHPRKTQNLETTVPGILSGTQ